MRVVVKFILSIAIMIGGANFFWCLMLYGALGGDAMGGSVRDGRYFLNNHGTETEVTRALWLVNLWSFRSLLVTFPMAFVASGAWWLLQKELETDTKPVD